MASAVRMKGYGTTLAYASAFNGGLTNLTGNAKIKLPANTRAITKTHDLLTKGTVTSQPQVLTSQAGWIDCGKIDVTAYFTQTQYTALLAIFQAGSEYYWSVTLPQTAAQAVQGDNLYFPGFVSELAIDEITNEEDNLVMVPFSIKLNDLVDYTNGF